MPAARLSAAHTIQQTSENAAPNADQPPPRLSRRSRSALLPATRAPAIVLVRPDQPPGDCDTGGLGVKVVGGGMYGLPTKISITVLFKTTPVFGLWSTT